MTNTIDVLVIDGPRSGLMFNTRRPVPDGFHFPNPDEPDDDYTHRVHTHANGKNYHIALQTVTMPSEEIDTVIDYHAFTPGWDINEATT